MCKLDIDTEYHKTGIKVVKVRQAVVMSTVQDRAVISEKSCVNDILEFLDRPDRRFSGVHK